MSESAERTPVPTDNPPSSNDGTKLAFSNAGAASARSQDDHRKSQTKIIIDKVIAQGASPTSPIISALLSKFRIVDVLTTNVNNPAAPTVRPRPPIRGKIEDAEAAVEVLLKLISQASESASIESEPASAQPGLLEEGKSTTDCADITVFLPTETGFNSANRPIYELDRNETLSDVARRFYGESAVAELIYKLNTSKIQAEFQRGLKLRLRMAQGIVLELPTQKEAARYLANTSNGERKRTLEYDIA